MVAGTPTNDDLVIELDDDQTAAGTPNDQPPEVAEHQQIALQSTALPDEQETGPVFADDDDGSPSRAPAAQGREAQHAGEAEDGADDGRGYDESYERQQAADNVAKQAQANVVWTQAQANAQVAEQQANTLKVGIDSLKLRQEWAEDQLQQAIDAGDDPRAAGIRRKIEKDLREMERLMDELTQAQRQLPDPRQILHEGQQRAHQILNRESPGKRVGNGITARHPLAERFAAANPWMKTHAAANKFVIAQSSRMHAEEGYDMNSPGFYTELARRVQNAWPKLKVQTMQAARQAPGKAQMRTPVAGARSSAGQAVQRGGAATGKTYRITASEQATMKRLRLDPANPQHQKAWAKSRMESARRMQNQ